MAKAERGPYRIRVKTQAGMKYEIELPRSLVRTIAGISISTTLLSAILGDPESRKKHAGNEMVAEWLASTESMTDAVLARLDQEGDVPPGIPQPTEWWEQEYWATVHGAEVPVTCWESKRDAEQEAEQYGSELVRLRVIKSEEAPDAR